MTKKKDRIITFILVLIIIILINAIINQFNPSLDLTRDKVYSLSKESKTLIKNIKEPMSVKFFITPNLPPPFSTYEKYVRDIFEEYKSKNISFEIIDASKNQSLANQYGISSSQISVLERDQTQTKVAYMGLAFLYGDSIETIPFIESTEGLEYRIDTAIRKMIDKNDKLKRLENNLNVYYISSPEIYGLLPIGAANLVPESIMQAVNEANKNLMNKVVFTNINIANSEDEIKNEELLKKLNIEKLKWEDIKDEKGNIVANKGSGYFSLFLENGNDIKELSTASILYGDFSAIKDDILKNIDGMLGIKATVGYITGHGEPPYFDIPEQYGGNPNDRYNSFTEYLGEIEANYNYQVIDTTKEDIPSNIDALIIAGGKVEWTESELYKLDQFIMRGKPVLFMISGVEMDENNPNSPIYGEPVLVPVTNGLNNMIQNYGLTVATNMVFDEYCYRSRREQNAPEQMVYYVPAIATENINPKSDITKSINAILVPMVSEVLINTNIDGLKITPLFHTSVKSWTETQNISSSMSGAPSDANRLYRRLIGAVSEGKMESAFLNKDIPNQSDLANINRINSTTDGKIILIGSYDIAKNSAYTVNRILLMNLVDYMAGDVGLMSIRRKGAIFNPPYKGLNLFGVIINPEISKLLVRIVNIVIVPLAVIVFGLALWNSDKKRRKKIFEKFNNAEKE